MESIFFGYATGARSPREAMRAAANSIEKDFHVQCVPWETMLTDGRVVIDQVTAAIDAACMCVFDLTKQSENVLFELGYAIARAKPIWITLDSTVSAAKRDWRELGLLNPIGYTQYRNSDDFLEEFKKKDPLKALEPVYDDLIEPNLPLTSRHDAILYCLTFEPFEASKRLSVFMDSRRQRGMNVVVADPSESTLDTITWFAPIIARSAGILVHFAGSHRNRSSLYNRRYALVAGMAHGLDVPLLMLAEDEYSTPFDYQTLLRKYETAEQCTSIARDWIAGLSFEEIDWSSPRPKLRRSLSGLRFGEHVAENELANLAEYFIETAAFEEVVAARDTIFVGHRGTGKTANATRAFDLVAGDKTSMAILIKPPGFEFPALFSVIGRLPNTQRDYFLDALWRFIVQTEIAAAALSRIESRPNVPLDAAERSFVEYADAAPFDIRGDLSVRLEQALRHLQKVVLSDATATSTTRNLINEAFHEKALVILRHQLGVVLKDKRRVAVFVDNLDKGWEKGADFKQVARLILGLLTARGRLVRDFEKQDYWRDRIRLTVAMFLRSDIYEYLRKEAREPDKLPISTIAWRDSATLLTVIESRFLASDLDDRRPSDLWDKRFCAEVDGQPTKTFITSLVLPRPRDIVFYCNQAVGRAIDRRHDRVEEDDFIAAEETYSQYAYEALLVENGVTIPEMEDALLGFLEAPEVLTRRQALMCIATGGISEGRREDVLAKLVSISFLGLETTPGTFTYPEAGSQSKRAYVQAARLSPDNDEQRFRIHRAFHSFLLIQPSRTAI